MEREIREERELLDERGHITEEGYARLPYWRYRREKVRAPRWRIKEWDYYAVIDQEREAGITITASDLGYAGLFALCFIDIRHGLYRQIDALKPLPMGRTSLAETADEPHRLAFSNRSLRIELIREGAYRRLRFSGGRIEGELELYQPPEQERMVIATSWAEKRTAFYYNQKINCMPARGRMRAEGEEFRFNPAESFGVLDWGRGRWTYRNRWYWASASGTLGGVPFGLNLGYGFSDRSPASENMLFYAGTAHKLAEVSFRYDEEDLLRPWDITSSDGRCELQFRPSLDRASHFDLLLVKSLQHQCFGRFSGTVRLDDGTPLELSGLPGFIEDVYNRW
jgi:hypothetical protein